MIEYTESIYYLGIPWLTREVVAFSILILVILLIFVVLFNTRNIIYSKYANLVMGLMIIMLIGLVALQFWVTSWKDNTKVKPLLEISNVITVQNNKITIDKLPENYKFKKLDEINVTLNANEQHIFEFSHSDFYNEDRLIDRNGHLIKLSDEDTKFLKERGVK
jgi:hypothetical protein